MDEEYGEPSTFNLALAAMSAKFGEPNMTPRDRKLFTAMSDLNAQHGRAGKHNSINIELAKAVYAAMATRTYRIQIQGDGLVTVSSWGLAKDVEDTYDSVDYLPTWMQQKIAVLMIFDPEKVNDEIAGVGRRISKGTFWVYPDEGEDDGDDTRTKSEATGS